MCTMAQVLNQFGDAYSARYVWTPEQAKVAACIRGCRTEALGSYRLLCEQCGTEQQGYCACRNRHCPHCQRDASLDWLERQRQSLLPVAYFHLVFTLPHELNAWVRLHPEVLYRSLFQVVWATLKGFGEDPKRLNGQLGMTAVLHTWGQALDQHVHLHCLIPAGAWSEATHDWHAARSNYLFPVKALARVYRGKLVSALRTAATAGELHRLNDKTQITQTLHTLMQKTWVVYTKACHGQPEKVVEYLSRYTHRIALSEQRLLTMNNEHVALRWKDYRDGKQKVMQLSGVELIRRFLQHVLPSGFMRIRHYGILSNRWRKRRVAEIRDALAMAPEGNNAPVREVRQDIAPEKIKGCWRCPACASYRLKLVSVMRPIRRALE